MRSLGKVLLLTVAIVGAAGPTLAEASTKARSRAETVWADAAPRMAAGWQHACQIQGDGTVRCWGRNDKGQLGDGSTEHRSSPVTVAGLNGAVAVAAGEAHSCALLVDRSVRCWGDNAHGQLGIGTFGGLHATPAAVAGVQGAVQLTAGGRHACALLADGGARCWGYGRFGQLGDRNNQDRPAAVVVGDLAGAVAIAAGDLHTCAVWVAGTVSCWGNNDGGQLGNGTLVSRTAPGPVSNLGSAVAVTAGWLHTCA